MRYLTPGMKRDLHGPDGKNVMISQRSRSIRSVCLVLFGASAIAPSSRAGDEPARVSTAEIIQTGPTTTIEFTPATRDSGTDAPREEGVPAKTVTIKSGALIVQQAPINSDVPLAQVDRHLPGQVEGPSSTLAQSIPAEVRRQGPTIQIPGNISSEFSTGVITFSMAADEFGMSLSTLDEAIITQLNLPNRQGLVVSRVQPDSSAEKAGIHLNDILLALDSEPIKSRGHFVAKLKAKDEQPAELTVLRGGKNVTFKILPRLKLDIAPFAPERPAGPEYWIGVPVSRVDDLLQTQLNLKPGEGLLVTEVVKESPAEKGGLRVNDILLELEGESLRDPLALRAKVQGIGAKPIELKLLRAGKPMTVKLTPEARATNDMDHTARIFSDHQPERTYTISRPVNPPAIRYNPIPIAGLHPGNQAALVGRALTNIQLQPSRVDAGQDKLIEEIESLKREIKELREAIRGKEKEKTESK